MLHELLLALLGFTGDFVLDASSARRRAAPPEAAAGGGSAGDGDGEAGPAFRLAPDLTFLQPSERSAIERLISLGFYYRELNRFATESRDLSWIHSSVDVSTPHADKTQKGTVRKGSVYRRAIANGITEILSVYRSAVLQVEQNLLSDPLPILATVTHGLNKFEVLLPPLYELVMEIEQKDIKGGQLLNLLHKRCHCGVPELQNCIQRLLWHGHQVMFNQLTSWMVYGILQDQYSEFFIRRQDDRDEEFESSQRDVSEKFIQKLAKDTSLTSWHTGFHVSLDMLPEYIHMRVAESILFAGKAIRVLRNPSPGATLQEPVIQSQNPKGSHRMHSFIGGSGAPKELPNFFNISAEELLPQAEADKIDSMLKELKHSPEFHKRPFESAVSSTHTIAASHLWQLVVVRADLNGHLKALKDYFLLAKGDFFQCFLEESRQLMRLPPRQSTAEADLMIPFQLAALKTIGEEDEYFTRVSLRMSSYGMKNSTSQKDLQKPNASELPSQGKAASELALDGWDSIALEYSVDWPLQLFFTPDVLSKYCKVFQYLIRLKRTQMELEKSWAAVMHKDHANFSDYYKDRKNGSATQLRRQRSKPLWRVREHMAFLIRNLQFYIQVDVIESQWNVLQSHVQDSHDFTELVSFHQEYLSALVSQSFLDIGSVSRILDSIMKLCLQFCWSIEQYETHPNIFEIDHITEEFNKKSNSLYTILRSSRLAGSQRAPFLRQFLMRLNFNSFFETTARGVMSSGRLRPSTAGT
ncbi:gamma-tubulin complex component 4-like [Phragmites australis]|uniref:gamma-tubulin complex component 4-like n=1 Tax=Phragmites australis TaxID=29695 RepID=UPI002D7844E5|nr:gamma-tubulin complex component 4-like [Phragmites australis]